MIFKFIKFIIVGFSGLIIDFSITFLCKEKILLNKYISNSFGFIIATSSNYLLNRIWTFNSINTNITMEFSAFIIVSIIGLLINNSVLWGIHQYLKTNFYSAKFGAIVITSIWNFFANYFFTFQM